MTELRLNRLADRGSTDRATLDALLDDQLVGSLATVVDGRPWVVPMLFARDGDRILLHGSTGAGALRHVAAGTPAALSVVALDGLVVAHTTFDSSANYRSAVVYGTPRRLTGDERGAALEKLSERLLPGRNAEVRPTSAKELAATLVMELTITPGAYLVKTRTGGTGEPDEPTDAWMGVIPLRMVAGEPIPEEPCRDQGLPESVVDFVRTMNRAGPSPDADGIAPRRGPAAGT